MEKPASTIAFLQNFNAACDQSYIQKGAEKWLFKLHLNGPVDSVIKVRVAIPAETAKAKEMCLTLYSAITNYLLNRYATSDNIAIVDSKIRTFKQDRLKESDYAQPSCAKTLRCGSVYTQKMLKGLFVEGISKTICYTLFQ